MFHLYVNPVNQYITVQQAHHAAKSCLQELRSDRLILAVLSQQATQGEFLFLCAHLHQKPPSRRACYFGHLVLSVFMSFTIDYTLRNLVRFIVEMHTIMNLQLLHHMQQLLSQMMGCFLVRLVYNESSPTHRSRWQKASGRQRSRQLL